MAKRKLAAVPTPPTPLELPSVLEREDLLRVQVLTERSARLLAQKQVLESQASALAMESQANRTETSAHSAHMNAKYRLGPDDSVSIATGLITRKRNG